MTIPLVQYPAQVFILMIPWVKHGGTVTKRASFPYIWPFLLTSSLFTNVYQQNAADPIQGGVE